MEEATKGGITDYWRWDMSNGWTYLLPPLVTRRVLCLTADPELAASQANLFGQLVLIRDAGWPGLDKHRDHPATDSAGPLQWRDIDEIVHASDAPFDGLIVHDPRGALVHHATLPRFDRMLRALLPRLRRGAFVYTGIRHSGSLKQRVGGLLRSASAARHRLCSVAQVRARLQALGVEGLQTHPYLLSGPLLSEVLTSQGYQATKNREDFRERIKEKVYGPWGAQRFAPAYGLVGSLGPAEESTLTQVMAKVERGGLVPFHTGAVLKQYLVFPGDKAIASFGPAGRSDADVVAILAVHALAVSRRQAEAETLQALSALPEPISRLTPRVLDQYKIGNTTVFAINRFPGVSVDRDVPALEAVTHNALQFIIDFHRQTAQPVTLDEDTYRSSFGSLIDDAVARNPSLEADLRALDGPLRKRVLGSTLPRVWQHGDFKVENVLYDPGSLALTGVIDWELATRAGLPALDPLYLMVYNRQIRGRDWVDTLSELLVRGQYTALERERLQRYMQALGVPMHHLPALTAAFLLHHIGHRIHLLDPPPFLQQLRELFHEMREVLERPDAHPRPETG